MVKPEHSRGRVAIGRIRGEHNMGNIIPGHSVKKSQCVKMAAGDDIDIFLWGFFSIFSASPKAISPNDSVWD